MRLEDLPVRDKDDALTLLCLDLIGTGMTREVYTCTLDPSKWVVKVETRTGYFQNVREHAVWEAAKSIPEIARYLAPVVNISDSGCFLVQRRIVPAPVEILRQRLPRVPAFFTDFKASNWGWLDGRLVCCDYGIALTCEYGLTKRLRKADW